MTKPEIVDRRRSRPTGLLGTLVARGMARTTRPKNEPALQVLDLANGDGEILLAADAMVRLSNSVGDTRTTVHCADTSELQFLDNRFDKVLSLHTFYF